MTSPTRVVLVLALVAIVLGTAPTWSSTEFFATKRVRELSIGVLPSPVLEIREVFARSSVDASEWTRLERTVDWEPAGLSAFLLMVGCVLLAAVRTARRRRSALATDSSYS